MKIPILMYHRIGNNSVETQFTVSSRSFEQQMRSLRDLSYNVVNLDQVVAALEGRTVLPSKSVAITFDDGFRETFENATPILNNLGYTATFFLVSQLMGQTSTWMEREGYPSARLMDWAGAKELLKQGFTVGSHSRTHPSLTQLDGIRITDEVEGSRRDLEDRLGTPIRYFAYPYGHFNDLIRNAVHRCGYVVACSTQSGFNNVSTDRWGLRRLDINRHDSMRMFARSLTFGQNHMRLTDELNYYLRQAFGLIHTKEASFGA